MKSSIIALAVALVVTPLASAAAAGELDLTFAEDGRVLTDFGQNDILSGVALQADGKIVAVGWTQELAGPGSQFAVARYAPDGSLDEGFGTGGKIATSFGESSQASARAVVIQSDGKLVVGGSALALRDGQLQVDIALARYNPDGSADDSFGSGGKVLTDFDATHDTGSDVAIQPDGKLIVAGTTRPIGPLGTPRDFALVRYNADGSLDESFGGDGKVSTDFAASSDDFAHGVAFAPDGRIVVAGYRINRATFTSNLELARYEPDGDLDATFGDGGKVLDDSSGSTGAFDVTVEPDQRVVAAGAAEPDLAVFRFTAGGEVDSTFGANGVASTDFGLATSGALALARQPDGKLVVAGAASPDAEPDAFSPFSFAVARFDGEGQLDETFHGGTVLTELGVDTYDEARAIALQPDGKIVVGGFTATSAATGDDPADFALVRYLPARGYTPTGSNVEIFPVDETTGDTPVRVTFSSVTAAGVTTLATGDTGPVPPTTWLHGRPVVYYDLTTTAEYSGLVEVCVDREGIAFADDPQLYHFVDGAWDDVVTYEYVGEPGIACGEVESLSPFALFAQDTVAPTNPSLSSQSHSVGVWLSDNTVDVLWAGASDNWSGIDGYSYQFGPNPAGVPDTAKDAEETASGATSSPLGDGERYFHLRSVDNAGNWSETVHLGPFRIDRASPLNPTLRSISHIVGTSSTDTTVEIAWSGASDATSGVDGFSFQWSEGSPAAPDTIKDAEETAAGTTSAPLSPGSWYLNLRTRDHAGNWSGATGIGPFIIARPGTRVRCVVPNVKGKTLARARAALRARRCAPGRIKYAFHRTIKKGRVIAQTRRPGTRYPRGTKVNLIVSKGRRR
jgi:uncharacterized delta-60 repeat protein